MSYDHSKQFRAKIVRGRSKRMRDTLLPEYARIIEEICPCEQTTFAHRFNQELEKFPGIGSIGKKALDNHRTETAGKLLGMHYRVGDQVMITERAQKLLVDGDNPAFFKDLLAKHQFPSGMSKIHTIREQMDKGVSVRQFPFLLACLVELQKQNIPITKEGAGYYILNSLDVLTGTASPEEVADSIAEDHRNGITRSIDPGGRASSYWWQHINEQIGLVLLANLVYEEEGSLSLNGFETKCIRALAAQASEAPAFDYYSKDLETPEARKSVEEEWVYHFSRPSGFDPSLLTTRREALERRHSGSTGGSGKSTKETGEEGEDWVWGYEIDRVGKDFPDLIENMKKVGHLRGLGYDIESVHAEGGCPELPKYIEVKATKRVSELKGVPENDSINLTRKEWEAAEEHKDNFFIYRVYFSSGKTRLFVVQNPFEKSQSAGMKLTPTTYRAEITDELGDFH